jgi:D-alanyl-D-alanine carboxypeptidase
MLLKIFLIVLLKIVIISLCLSCSNESPPTASNPSLAEQLQKALDDRISNYDGKGVSLAVIMPDQKKWAGTSGISHGTTAISADMLFSAGSITKTFTAATIIQLAEEHKLSLDDSLYKWISNYSNIDSTITIRQLLNHTSGLYDIADNSQLFDKIFLDQNRNWTIEEILREYVLEPYFPKGTGWHYSNTGYVILRSIIKQASNSEISSQYRSRFLNPLNLNRTFLAPYETLPKPIAHGWHDFDGFYEELPEISMTSFYSAAGGGIFTTAIDLAAWANSLFHEQTAVSTHVLDEMLDFYSPITNQALLSGYGLGVEKFNLELFNGLEIWGHGGDPVGYAAGCFYIPQYGVSIGIMDNTAGGETMDVIFDIVDIITNYLVNES